jgi:hypothetical protein
VSAPRKWGHDELATDLANHLRTTSDVMAWENMQLGPSGSPRPDVYAVKKSFSRFAPIAYEAKISIADFRRDVTAGKWQTYLQFASAVVFAAPAGLITKADIPNGCGLIIRHESGWKVAKGPTLGNLGNLPRDAWLKLLMDGIDRETTRARIQSRGEGSIWAADTALRKKLGDELGGLVRTAYLSADSLKTANEAAQRERDEIRQGTHAEVLREIQWRKDALDREAARINEAQLELARVLGLPPEASTAELAAAMRGAARRIEGDREVQRLRDFFRRVQDMSKEGVEPVPGDMPVAVSAPQIW